MTLLTLWYQPRPPKLTKMPYVIYSADPVRRRKLYTLAWTRVDRFKHPEKYAAQHKRRLERDPDFTRKRNEARRESKAAWRRKAWVVHQEKWRQQCRNWRAANASTGTSACSPS